MTRRHLLFAVLLTAAAVVKGDMTSWLCEQCDGLDLGWDVPDYVPDGLAGDR